MSGVGKITWSGGIFIVVSKILEIVIQYEVLWETGILALKRRKTSRHAMEVSCQHFV
jgi:hypothetical protein